MVFGRAHWYVRHAGGRPATGMSQKERALSQEEKLIADIMGAQIAAPAPVRRRPVGSALPSQLTMSQLKILLLLSTRHGTSPAANWPALLGVGAAALSGMIDRLVVQDLVARTRGPARPAGPPDRPDARAGDRSHRGRSSPPAWRSSAELLGRLSADGPATRSSTRRWTCWSASQARMLSAADQAGTDKACSARPQAARTPCRQRSRPGRGPSRRSGRRC